MWRINQYITKHQEIISKCSPSLTLKGREGRVEERCIAHVHFTSLEELRSPSVPSVFILPLTSNICNMIGDVATREAMSYNIGTEACFVISVNDPVNSSETLVRTVLLSRGMAELTCTLPNEEIKVITPR